MHLSISDTTALVVQAIASGILIALAIASWRRDHIISLICGFIGMVMVAAILGNIAFFQMLLTVVAHV